MRMTIRQRLVAEREMAVRYRKALLRISDHESRPSKEGKVDLSEVQDLQRIARMALTNAPEEGEGK